MKIIVKESFLDKNDMTKSYAPGTVLDWDDKDRIRDCEKRGLIEVIKDQEPEDVSSAAEEPKKKSGKKKK